MNSIGSLLSHPAQRCFRASHLLVPYSVVRMVVLLTTFQFMGGTTSSITNSLIAQSISSSSASVMASFMKPSYPFIRLLSSTEASSLLAVGLCLIVYAFAARADCTDTRRSWTTPPESWDTARTARNENITDSARGARVDGNGYAITIRCQHGQHLHRRRNNHTRSSQKNALGSSTAAA